MRVTDSCLAHMYTYVKEIITLHTLNFNTNTQCPTALTRDEHSVRDQAKTTKTTKSEIHKVSLLIKSPMTIHNGFMSAAPELISKLARLLCKKCSTRLMPGQ
mmetsp:Transcript_9201/g.17381  ORF Transcript_9201/g.17381 Transcript_9201/m.17381 type:complete len:102 (-) Transcript_9201:4120-4425(-)